MTTPNNPRKYTGTDQFLIPFVTRQRRPTSADFRQPETGTYYPVGAVWQVGKNPSTGTEGELWMLSKIVANQGYWVAVSTGLSPGGGPVLALQDTAGTEVFTTALGDIQLRGSASEVSIVSDPANNRLDFSLVNGIPIVGVTTNLQGPVVPSSLGVIHMDTATSTFTDGPVGNNLKVEVQGTNHALFVGRGTNVVAANLAVGVDHSLMMGNTGADPAFTTTGTPYVSSISFDSGTNSLQRFTNTTNFTPTIFGGTVAGVGTYSEQSGRYSIIGNMLFYNINLLWTAHTGTGDMMVGGFPNAFAAGQSFYPAVCMAQNIVFPASTNWITVDGVNNTTTAEVVASVDSAVFANVQMDAAGSLHISGWYPINA